MQSIVYIYIYISYKCAYAFTKKGILLDPFWVTCPYNLIKGVFHLSLKYRMYYITLAWLLFFSSCSPDKNFFFLTCIKYMINEVRKIEKAELKMDMIFC